MVQLRVFFLLDVKFRVYHFVYDLKLSLEIFISDTMCVWSNKYHDSINLISSSLAGCSLPSFALRFLHKVYRFVVH